MAKDPYQGILRKARGMEDLKQFCEDQKLNIFPSTKNKVKANPQKENVYG